MPDLLALSTRIIDEGVVDQPVNRITQELSEIAEGLAIVESFSHVVAFRTDAGLVLFDSSGKLTGRAVVGALSHAAEKEHRSAAAGLGHAVEQRMNVDRLGPDERHYPPASGGRNATSSPSVSMRSDRACSRLTATMGSAGRPAAP